MKRWGYCINSYHKKATIFCEVAPFYIFWLEGIVQTICGEFIPAIPLPKFPLRLKDDEIEDNDGKRWTTYKDWCGDLSQWFCAHIDMPVFDFCNNKCKKHYSINIPYQKLKKSFYEMDKDFLDEEEQSAKEMRLEERKNESIKIRKEK